MGTGIYIELKIKPVRKLIFGINLTLDGCCDHRKGVGSDDVHDYFGRLMREAGVLVYGRITYQLMVPFWPDVAKNPSGDGTTRDEFARAFDAVPRIVVFSRTLEQPQEEKTRVVRTNLGEEILKLKQEPGKAILVGGVALPAQLLELGLIDEFHIVVQPVFAGEGRRLFDDIRLPGPVGLTLAASTVLESGCVALRYVKHA